MLADGLVVVGGDGANLRDHLARHLLRILVERAGNAVAIVVERAAHGGNGLVDAALQGHRIRAGGNGLHAFAEDGLGQNGRGGGAVTGNVGGLGGDFADHLCAHVLERVLQLDFLGYGHAVLGNERRTKLLLDHDIAALGTERDFYGIGQNIHAAKDRLARIFSMHNLLCHCFNLLMESVVSCRLSVASARDQSPRDAHRHGSQLSASASFVLNWQLPTGN